MKFQINLNDIVEELGEDREKSIFSEFSCPLNKDVENFLNKNQLNLQKDGLGCITSFTHVIFPH